MPNTDDDRCNDWVEGINAPYADVRPPSDGSEQFQRGVANPSLVTS